MIQSSRSRKNTASSTMHAKMQASTTLNRKYVKQPIVKTTEIQSLAKREAADLRRRQAIAEQINRQRLMEAKKRADEATTTKAQKASDEPIAPAKTHPYQKLVKRQIAARRRTTSPGPQLTARELKDQAIKKALARIATAEKQDTPIENLAKRTFGAKKIAFAIACATVFLVITGYLLHVNMPHISVQVAALQAGVEATYPSFIPSQFSLKKVYTNNKKISLVFSDKHQDFTLTEEKSTWDSNALLNNYVKKAWETYDTVREQGLTIFISGSNAVWVNSGIFYEITADNPETLTKKQIRSIATSL